MKILVTGANGLLGSAVTEEVLRRGHTCIATGRAPQPRCADATVYAQADLCDPQAVQALITDTQPDAVIHCAAWTDVDGAELPENREQVFAINAGGTKNVAEACRGTDCKMIYITTDYVFDGTDTAPYSADCTHFAPLNVYGQSKLAGEHAVAETLERYFIVRTSWVYGTGGKNFVHTMLQLSRTHDTLRVVSDQIGTPTYTYDLARLLVDMIETDKYGYYHATNEGLCSWYEFAVEIFKQAGMDVKVTPVSTAEYTAAYPGQAKRPMNSRISKEKLSDNGFELLPSWQDAVGRYLKEIQ